MESFDLNKYQMVLADQCSIIADELSGDDDASLALDPHQSLGIQAAVDALEKGDSRFSIVHPGGSGKTLLEAIVLQASQRAKKVIGGATTETQDVIFAVERSIVKSIRVHLERMDIDFGLWGMGERKRDRPVILSTIQALERNKKRASGVINPDKVALIVGDEADKFLTPKRMRILDQFEAAQRIGLTATPTWPDERHIDDAWGKIVHHVTLREGIQTGINVPPFYIMYKADFQAEDVKIVGGDFHRDSLSAAMKAVQIEKAIPGIYESIVPQKRYKEFPTIIYVPNVDILERTTENLRQLYGPKNLNVSSWTGDISNAKLNGETYDFEQGKIDILVLCKMGGRGLNLPSARCIIDGDPTLSLNKLEQRHSRALRRIRNGTYLDSIAFQKPFAVIVQIIPRSNRFRPAQLCDVLDCWPEGREPYVPPERFRGGGTENYKNSAEDINCIISQILAQTLQSDVGLHENVDVLREIRLRKDIPRPGSEEFLDYAKELLAEYEITDRRELLQYGVLRFLNTNFIPFGRGKGFAAAIIGHTFADMSVAILEEVSDSLGFQELSEEERNLNIREALTKAGIPDTRTLLLTTKENLFALEFAPYGKICSLISAAFSRPMGKPTKDILRAFASKIGLPELSEETKRKHREAFAAHDIVDHGSMMKLSERKFSNTQFTPYGGRHRFVNAINGRQISPFSKALSEAAKVLGWEASSENDMQERFKNILYQAGVIDLNTILRMTVNDFCKLNFKPYESARTLVGEVLGRKIDNKLTISDLSELARVIGLPEIADSTKVFYREALKKQGFEDRESFLGAKIIDLQKMSFPPFGGAVRFASCVLGRRVKAVSIDVVLEVAQKIGLKERNKANQYVEQRKLLEENGIRDRRGLQTMTIREYMNLDFGDYGTGTRFAQRVLGYSGRVYIKQLEEIADVLGLPEISEETKSLYRAAFAAKEITDRSSLLATRITDFNSTSFPLYGKGQRFAWFILGKQCRINKQVLVEIAESIGWKDESEDEKKSNFSSILAAHGITCRRALFSFGATSFMSTSFLPFGKGLAFAGEILGETLRAVSTSDLERISEFLSLPELSEEIKAQYKAALAAKGITDRSSLKKFGVSNFKKSKFPPYGGGAAFLSEMLGKKNVTVRHLLLEEVADLFGWQEDQLERGDQFRNVLRDKGIIDRTTLRLFGTEKFLRTEFSLFGKGTAFASAVLGRIIPYPSAEILEQIASFLELPRMAEETKSRFRDILLEKGIVDKDALLKMAKGQLILMDFGEYGKGRNFASIIVGEASASLREDLMSVLAEILY